MGECKTKDGEIITDDDLERLGEACERGDYPGEPGEWMVKPTTCDDNSDE